MTTTDDRTLDPAPIDHRKTWRYRVRGVKRGLTLRTRGQATLIRDELQNTYEQRKPRPAKTGC